MLEVLAGEVWLRATPPPAVRMDTMKLWGQIGKERALKVLQDEMDAGVVERVQNCTKDSARSSALVKAMNQHPKDKGIHGYPTIYVGGHKQDSESGKTIVAAICKLAQEQMPDVVRTVPACGGTAPAGTVYE